MAVLIAILLTGCRAAKHVPKGKYLLEDVNIEVSDSSGKILPEEMLVYVHQHPNHKMLWLMKLQLGMYNLSGEDSTKWYNKWARKMGEKPVIYDSVLTAQSVRQLQSALINKGYLHAGVSVDTVVSEKRDKISLTYRLYPGTPHIIGSISYNFPSDTIRKIIMRDSIRFPVAPGDLLDRDRLEKLREIITGRMRNSGYFGFSKDQISFSADTVHGSEFVDLTMNIRESRIKSMVGAKGRVEVKTNNVYKVRNIYYVTDYDAVKMPDFDFNSLSDTVRYRDLQIIYGDRRYLRPSVLYENCYVRSGNVYSERAVDRTYQALSRLPILKFINIRTLPVSDPVGESGEVDVFILLTPGKSQTISFEMEGTNSAGDLGVAAGVTYSHRNIGKGSETFSVKLRGAYESLSGNLDGLLHNRYMEYSMDLGLSLPKFQLPFVKESFKRRIRATTDFSLSLDYQERPEYTRVLSSVGWRYKWVRRRHGVTQQHIFSPIDIDYIYLPESTENFIDQIAPNNPLLRYSYEDHFIMRLGYSFYQTNKMHFSDGSEALLPDVYSLHLRAETGGNLLYAISQIADHRNDAANDPYKIFGIRYSQYVKFEGDYGFSHAFNKRHSLAFHVGLGVAYPYGNSNVLPFEKRFYGGGANGVRGWDVRTLGPGTYNGSNSVSDFIHQCGDIRLDLSVEYRAKLFWILEGALFVDAGNIWTIHDYESQPGGMFRFNSFYKQLAASYGLGLRMDFNYFLIRLDMGMKAHNPAEGQQPWPLVHPRWKRDHSFHFSIGYPF